MINSYIKYFFIVLCAVHTYKKIYKLDFNTKQKLVSVLYCILMPFIAYLSRLTVPHLTVLILAFSLVLFALFQKVLNVNLAIISSIISYSLSYMLFSVSSIVSIIVLSFFFNNEGELGFFISIILSGVIQIIMNIILFRIKNLHFGMPFFLNNMSGDFAIFLGIFVLVSASFITNINAESKVSGLSLLIPILGFIFYCWWRQKNKDTYIFLLTSNKLQNLQDEREKYMEENERLSSIVHRNTKLINAMIFSLKNYIDASQTDTTLAKNELINSLNELLVSQEMSLPNVSPKTSKTNVSDVDFVLEYMAGKAASEKVDFSFQTDCDIATLTNSIVSSYALKTLLADLIENAIISTRGQENKKISASITMEDGIYRLNIFDTGSLFDENVLLNMGIMRTTTHKDTGGSGIGLMTMWDILDKFYASYELDETVTSDYSKKISIIFDGNHTCRIISNRKSLINKLSIRKDIYVVA